MSNPKRIASKHRYRKLLRRRERHAGLEIGAISKILEIEGLSLTQSDIALMDDIARTKPSDTERRRMIIAHVKAETIK